jgi:hypothetical protein
MGARLVIDLADFPIPTLTSGDVCIPIPKYIIPYLLGYLDHLRYPDVWSGSDLEKSTMSAVISTLMAELIVYQECGANQPQNDGTDEPPMLAGGCSDDCEDCEMSGCSIPYGSIRWNQGVLQYLSCGTWYDVEGEADPDAWPPPGDDDDTIIDPPPGAYEPNACDKALAWTNVLFDVVDAAADNATAANGPWAFENDVRSRWPTITFGRLDLYNVYAAALTVALEGYLSETEDPDVQQDIICRVKEVMSLGQQGMTEDEFDAAQDAVDAVVSTAFGLVQYPTTFTPMRNMYRYAASAIGAGDSRKITEMIPAQVGACECSDYEEPYVGSVRFAGNLISAQFPSRFTEIYASNNGKRLHVKWSAPSGQFASDDQFKTGLIMDAPINSVKIACRPLTANGVPTAEWRVEPQCVDPLEWRYMRFGSAWTHTPAVVNGEQHTLVTANTPPQSDTDGELYFRKCPSEAGSPAKVYEVEYEIIEINGLPV